MDSARRVWHLEIVMFRGTALCEALEPRVQFSHPTFTLSFNDPGATNAVFYPALRSIIAAAGADWGQYFDSSARIDVEIDFTTADIRSTGSSVAQRFVRQAGAFSVYQAGAAAKLTTGVDVNGSTPDVVINLGDAYLNNELWFDPSPNLRTASIPVNKTDAYSVLLHELGHGLGLNGYRDGFDGTISGSAETTYDASTAIDHGNFFFTGPTASNWYGQQVPLTFGNISHVGNSAPRPGVDLVADLMNGVVFNRGTRYEISGTDLAILQDTGLPPALFPWSTVTGQVFFDSNHNGVANRREPPLAGWRIYADLNGNGLPDSNEPTAVTDSSGMYTMAGLHPGRYVIRSYGKRHWALTAPASGYVLVKTRAGRTFGVPAFGEYGAASSSAASVVASTVFPQLPLRASSAEPSTAPSTPAHVGLPFFSFDRDRGLLYSERPLL